MIYNLFDLLSNEGEGRAQRVAIVDGNRQATYEELRCQANRYARMLAEMNVRRFDRVALYMPRSIELAAALFGVWQAGAVAVIVNDVLKTKQVNHILRHSEATLLLSSTEFSDAFADLCIPGERIVCVERSLAPTEEVRTFPRPLGADLALIIYTSGSTGMPKGIMLSHANVLSGTRIVSDYLRITGEDIILSLLPFSFDYGLNQLLTSVYAGARLVIERSKLPADICNTVIRERVTGVACVPTLWQQLAGDRSPFMKTSFPHLRYMTNTGGRMPERLTRLYRRVHPHVQIYLMFGLTEAFRSTYLPPDQVDIRPTSIGKAIPDVEILVLDPEGKECEPGQKGELVHRGPTVAMGYWRDPEATAARFRPVRTGGGEGGIPDIAVFSGDTVTKDSEGYLYFVGRTDEMIKSHGMRVSPEEIEDCLYSSDLVEQVVAFSVPKDDVQQSIVAAIVARDPGSFDDDRLFKFARKEMPEFMRPSAIWRLQSFPQTSSGKPDRIGLREMYLAMQHHHA